MNARTVIPLAVALLTGCRIGPSYHVPAPVPGDATIRVSPLPDSSRAFFDSLAVARLRDTTAVSRLRITPRPFVVDSLAGPAWRDILRDTTLVRLVDTALDRNRNLQTAMARIREFRANAEIARAPLFPSLTVNASASSNQIALGIFPPASYRAIRVTGDVSWELDFWGRIRQGVTAANADVAAGVAAERAVALSIVSDVATAYLQLLELDQEHDIAQQTLATRRATLELARERFAQGVISELDVKQFEAQVAAPAVTLAATERARIQTEHTLNMLLGEAPTAIHRGGTLVRAVDALDVPDSVPATLLARRPDVEQAERNYAATTARLGVADAARMPTLMLGGAYGSQTPTPGDLFTSNTRIYQLQAGVSIPLFTGGRLAGQAAAARARVEQARAQYEETVLGALRDTDDALVTVRTARDQAVAQATQAEALSGALDLAQLRYQSGIASYLDVLEAERSLFTARLALSQAQLQQLVAAVQLYKALGGGWPTERR